METHAMKLLVLYFADARGLLFVMFKMFVEGHCMAKCLILYTCGNGTEKTWIYWLGSVAQHFCPYGVSGNSQEC